MLMWLLNLGFAASGSAAPEPPPPSVVAGGIGHGYKRRSKYPRRVTIAGRVHWVNSADEERALLRELQARAREQAQIAQALGDEPTAQAAKRLAVRIGRQVAQVDDREARWVGYLLAEDEEILLMLH